MKAENQSSTKAAHILVADDQADVLEAMRLLFKGEGIKVTTADSPKQVITILDDHDFDAVLIDLNYARDTTSGTEGLDLLTRIHQIDHSSLRGEKRLSPPPSPLQR